MSTQYVIQDPDFGYCVQADGEWATFTTNPQRATKFDNYEEALAVVRQFEKENSALVVVELEDGFPVLCQCCQKKPATARLDLGEGYRVCAQCLEDCELGDDDKLIHVATDKP
jgi:hypothetical protein